MKPMTYASRFVGSLLPFALACASAKPSTMDTPAAGETAAVHEAPADQEAAEPSGSDTSVAEADVVESGESGDAGPVIQVDIINRCSDTVDFCVITGPSERKTRLAASSHEWYRMSPGDTVKAMAGAYCGDVLFEVKGSPAEQEAILCK